MHTNEAPANMRHSLVTRVTHAAFTLAFFGLALSGAAMMLHARFIPGGPVLHRYLGLVMIASGVFYFAAAIRNGTFGRLIFTTEDARSLVPMTAYYLRLQSEPPPYEAYNPLQKLAYTVVLLTIGPALAATGVAMWPHLPGFSWLATLVGGKRTAVLFHEGFALEIVLFFAGHLFMVATTGLRANLRAIVTGSPGVGHRAFRRDSRGTGYTLRGGTALLAPSRTSPAAAGSDPRSPV